MPSLRLTPDMIDRLAQQQHERLRQDLSEIELSAPAPTTPSPLAKAVDAIRAAGGQADALRRLLAGASSLDARAALFVVRKESLSGWEGAGFDDDPAVAGSMEQISISRDEPAIAEVIASARPVLAEIHGTHPVPDFGQTVRGEALLLPIVVRDQVAGILYTDPLSSATPLDRAGLEVLAQITGLSVERLAYARMAPTASPAPSAQASETAPAAPSASDAGPPPSGSPDSSGATLSSGTAGAATTSGTFASAEPRDAVESVAPSPAEPSAPSGSAASGDAAQQDARRFARLLVEEICLYHGDRVEQGRRHQDLTQRLEEEIERAQAMYEQRVSPAVRSQGDFFHEALVQVLAGGNAGALGTGVRQPG